MNRGDVYIATMQGDYGKTRPVVIVQSNVTMRLDSRIVCPLTTHEEPAAFLRPRVEPTQENGLEHVSYVMVEKVLTLPPHRFRDRLGRLEPTMMATIGTTLAVLLDLG